MTSAAGSRAASHSSEPVRLSKTPALSHSCAGVVFPFQQCWLKNRGLSAQPRPWIGASPTTFTSGYLDARPAAAPTSSPGQVPVPGLRDDARPLLRSLPSGQTRVLVVCASGQQQKAVDLATSLGAPATWTVQAVKALVPASGAKQWRPCSLNGVSLTLPAPPGRTTLCSAHCLPASRLQGQWMPTW